MNKVKYIDALDYIASEKENDSELSKVMDEEKSKMDLAVEITELRRSMGLTQEEFAKKVNKPQSTIARIESGEENPTFKTIFEIGYAVGKQVNVSYE
ncbi:helix-turn-helix transcriptional regulator [Companilactobacillus hulinensis]|uniref:helix-turn-helix transcriptional regulator n=1 Tax=Companilactobacillus hulinensis TaxID=2486007 RepID=UPI000F7B3FCC|nr:helix-turn-helix transcriptional regulator [Companilactobacillus hulinensis]